MPALITRCPACATMFKVVPDQLRISEGWVRCGHCAEVFDASANLQDPQAVAQAQAAPPAPREAMADMAADSELEAASGAGAASERDSGLPSELPPGSDPSALHSEIDERLLPADEPDSVQLAAEAQALAEDPLDRPFELRREDMSTPAELMPRAPRPQVTEPPELEDLGFVRDARREARWQRPAVRTFLALAALALALLLAAQVAVHERDRLAAREPRLRPWLARLCAVWDCRIAAPRQIDAIAIDSSSFNKLRPEAYRLQVTLRNQSSVAVAMPALELTLTDGQEQPVVRRVLLASEVGPGRPAIAPGAEWSGSVAVAVTDNFLASRIAGYRLLAFYP